MRICKFEWNGQLHPGSSGRIRGYRVERFGCNGVFTLNRTGTKEVTGAGTRTKRTSRVFHSLYKVGRNDIIVFKGINNSKKKLPPVGLDLMQEIFTGLRVQCLTIELS